MDRTVELSAMYKLQKQECPSLAGNLVTGWVVVDLKTGRRVCAPVMWSQAASILRKLIGE